MGLSDDAILKIKSMILDGELKPGDRMPPEAQLAQQLGLSRNSLREAVRVLDTLRVLNVRQGDGTYVTSLRPDLLLEGLTFGLELHQDEAVLQFHELRLMLEPEVAAKAARLITYKELDQLQASVDHMRSAAGAEELVQRDVEFHRLISLAARNPVLTGLLDSTAKLTTRARVWRAIVGAQADSDAIAEHEGILRALRAHQPDIARAQMTVHIAGVERWLESIFGVAEPGVQRDDE